MRRMRAKVISGAAIDKGLSTLLVCIRHENPKSFRFRGERSAVGRRNGARGAADSEHRGNARVETIPTLELIRDDRGETCTYIIIIRR